MFLMIAPVHDSCAHRTAQRDVALTWDETGVAHVTVLSMSLLPKVPGRLCLVEGRGGASCAWAACIRHC